MIRDYIGLLSVPFIALFARDLYTHDSAGKTFDFTNLLKTRSWGYYLVLLGLVLPVWSIIPVSYAYVFYVLYRLLVVSSNPLTSTWRVVLFTYAILEVAFSIEHDARLHRLQRHVHGPLIDLNEMRALFARCHVNITAADLAAVFPKWFLGAPLAKIQRENVREWLCWAFCAKYLEEASPGEREMIDEMVTSLSQKTGHTFPTGRNTAVKCCRLTLDRVEGMGRPLSFYLATSGMALLMDMLLWLWGFRYHKSGAISYWIWTPPAGQKESEEEPIVFVHGIGVGLASYVPFVRSLNALAKEKGVPLILPTLPHVSMGLVQREIPDRKAMVEGLFGIFEKHGLEGRKATWVGHSLGSVVVGWICKENIEAVGRLALIDPVCFHLWEGDVCYNFVYKTPRNGNDLLMWYFVAREVGVSAALGRGFWWFENVLFPESLPPLSRVHVFFGSNDNIVNPLRLREYLTEEGVPVTTFRGLGHAGALVASSKARRRVIEFVAGGRD